jgi:hypothetical protein
MRPILPIKEIDMTKKFVSAKDFVVRNERKILVTALVVTTTTAVLMRTGLAQHDAFLKEHNLYEAFYTLNEV